MKIALKEDDPHHLKKWIILAYFFGGNWASSCKESLQQLKIHLSFEEIKLMSVTKFKKIVCIQIREEAFRYLKNKRGEKGSNFIYQNIEMAEYLLPDNCLTIETRDNYFQSVIK